MGLGGLGHMGVKLAASFGAEVTVLSRSPQKKADAISATSKGGENSSGGPETAAQAKKDTAASKAVPKQTTAEKQADVKSTATPKAATP